MLWASASNNIFSLVLFSFPEITLREYHFIIKTLDAAYALGDKWVEEGYCDGYNIGQNKGEAAGQTIMYPHIHLIPRRDGDMEDPRGGVRHVIPEKGNYKKWEKVLF